MYEMHIVDPLHTSEMAEAALEILCAYCIEGCMGSGGPEESCAKAGHRGAT